MKLGTFESNDLTPWPCSLEWGILQAWAWADHQVKLDRLVGQKISNQLGLKQSAFFWLEKSVKFGRFQSAPRQWLNFFEWMDWYNFASWVCQSTVHHLPLIENQAYRLNGKCTLSHFCIEICKYHFFLPNYLVVPVQIHTSKICPVVQGTFICQFLFHWELFPVGKYLRIVSPGLLRWEIFAPGFCTVTGNFRIVSGNNLLLSQFAFHSFVSFVSLIFVSPIVPCLNV